MEDVRTQVRDLLKAPDEELPYRLEQLARRVDQELERLTEEAELAELAEEQS